MNRFQWLLARLQEPSTLAGVGVMLSIFGIPAGLPEVVSHIAAGIAGALAIFLPERGTAAA